MIPGEALPVLSDPAGLPGSIVVFQQEQVALSRSIPRKLEDVPHHDGSNPLVPFPLEFRQHLPITFVFQRDDDLVCVDYQNILMGSNVSGVK